MPKLRIISPRWNAELDRFQLPNEIVEVPDSELPHWAAHTELVMDEQPQPEGAANEAAPSEPAAEEAVAQEEPEARPVLSEPVAKALTDMLNGTGSLRDLAVASGAAPEFDEIVAARREQREGSDPAQFACPDCDRTFDTERGLKTHSRTHRKE